MQQHGYRIEWTDAEEIRAFLWKGHDALRVAEAEDGTCSYTDPNNVHDRGDILEVEAWRSGKAYTASSKAIWPELERVGRQHGPVDRQA